MKNNTKSSITLPPAELAIVNKLMKKLKAKSKVEVIRRGLLLLQELHDTLVLKEQFKKASLMVRETNKKDYAELDMLSLEGLTDED